MKEKCKYDKSFRHIKDGSLLQSIAIVMGMALLFSCAENTNTEMQKSKSQLSNVPLKHVLKSVDNSVLTSIQTIHPVFKSMPMEVEADGYVDYDHRKSAVISSLYSGRIEKLYVKYNYQYIHKGQKVFEIYSPELVTGQENLIALLKHSPNEKELIHASIQKLKLLGFTDNMIKNLMDKKRVQMAVSVFSNYDGYAYEANSVIQGSNLQQNVPLSIQEGQYVMKDENLFNLMDTKTVVVILQIKQTDISLVHLGEKVEIQFENDTNKISGKVDFIEPLFNSGMKFLPVRVYINNTNGQRKIGSLVKGKIITKQSSGLWIPGTSLLDLGKGEIVWLKKNNLFTTHKVKAGKRSGDFVEIVSGLTEEDNIALEAHYLADSQGFIK